MRSAAAFLLAWEVDGRDCVRRIEGVAGTGALLLLLLLLEAGKGPEGLRIGDKERIGPGSTSVAAVERDLTGLGAAVREAAGATDRADTFEREGTPVLISRAEMTEDCVLLLKVNCS
jgi:hypothetical protein